MLHIPDDFRFGYLGVVEDAFVPCLPKIGDVCSKSSSGNSTFDNFPFAYFNEEAYYALEVSCGCSGKTELEGCYLP